MKFVKKIAITEFILPDSLLIIVVTETHEAGTILRHESGQAFRAFLANYMSERCVSFLAETLCLRVIKAFGREYEHSRFGDAFYRSVL